MMNALLISFLLTSSALMSSETCGTIDAKLSEIEEIYILGHLDQAIEELDGTLECDGLSSNELFEINLLMAKVHERTGLHNRNRPVEAARNYLSKAESYVNDRESLEFARVLLMKASLSYREEMNNREFPNTIKLANEALVLFRDLRNLQGEADAIHRIGLAHMQSRDLGLAETFFELSLEVESGAVSPRPELVGDYFRHMAFIKLLSGDVSASLPLFKQSFETRYQAGLRDQTIFAAVSYGAQLVRQGHLEQAKAPLVLASEIALEIESFYGQTISHLVLGEYYEAKQNYEQSITHYQEALHVAQKINYQDAIENAKERLEVLLNR